MTTWLQSLFAGLPTDPGPTQPQPMVFPTPSELVDALRVFRYPVTTEFAFQHAMDRVLTDLRVPFDREHDFGGEIGRVDFFLHESGIALELKIDGTPVSVLRQLRRYAEHQAVTAVVLATSRQRLVPPVSALNGKPLAALTLWHQHL